MLSARPLSALNALVGPTQPEAAHKRALSCVSCSDDAGDKENAHENAPPLEAPGVAATDCCSSITVEEVIEPEAPTAIIHAQPSDAKPALDRLAATLQERPNAAALLARCAALVKLLSAQAQMQIACLWTRIAQRLEGRVSPQMRLVACALMCSAVALLLLVRRPRMTLAVASAIAAAIAMHWKAPALTQRLRAACEMRVASWVRRV
jgi:hypothetical protein